MKNSNFMANLLNTLKNRRRLETLNVISKNSHLIATLQKELKKRGYNHSQQTINQEYLTPLFKVGLIGENQNNYYITLFGCELNKIINNCRNVGDILPAHSECYEETVLTMLQNKSRTYQDLENVIPAKSVARTLNRLQKAKLIETAQGNEYVFFFKTKRNSSNSKLSPTEQRVYENIPTEGISARKLSDKARISLRRTYKYLRRLKGKKLVFTRKTLKSYTLTSEGIQIAEMLRNIRNLVCEFAVAASLAFDTKERRDLLSPDT